MAIIQHPDAQHEMQHLEHTLGVVAQETALAEAAREEARRQGNTLMQVKTVAMGHYVEYDATNRFYQSLGFQELEIFPTLWGEKNPCQIYVMPL